MNFNPNIQLTSFSDTISWLDAIMCGRSIAKMAKMSVTSNYDTNL
jgi:hypothetical protein